MQQSQTQWSALDEQFRVLLSYRNSSSISSDQVDAAINAVNPCLFHCARRLLDGMPYAEELAREVVQHYQLAMLLRTRPWNDGYLAWPYAYSILVHICAAKRKRYRPMSRLDSVPEPVQERQCPCREAMRKELRRCVRKAVGALKPCQRKAVHSQHWEERTDREIAAQEGVAESTVGCWRHRATKPLRELLCEFHDD